MITSTNAGVDRFVAVNTADETPGTLEDKIDGVTIQVSDTDKLEVPSDAFEEAGAVSTHETAYKHFTSADVLAALTGAASPGGGNVFATMDDIPGEEIVAWQSFGNATTTSTSGFSVTDNATNQGIFTPGRPLKMVAGATTTYHIVESYSSGAVVLSGATLTDATEYAISYGDFTRVQKIDVNLSGAFAADATTTAITDQTSDPLYWDMGPGMLVAVKHIIQTEDSAATTTQPAINVFAGTPTASTTCSGSGTTYALDTLVLPDTLAVLDGSTPVTAYTLDPVTGSLELDESPSGTVTASYSKWVAGDTLLSSDDETDTSRQTATGNLDVAYGERVELKIVKATGGTPGDDAEDLSVSLLFVLK